MVDCAIFGCNMFNILKIISFPFFSFLTLIICDQGWTASNSNLINEKSKTGLFDSSLIRKHYHEGDFEQAISILELSLKEKKIISHSDSVFTFKHLGVMYAANERTRERGKYYMLQLLTIEPTARIMDMYASDMIYMIFKNLQEEFASTHQNYGKREPIGEDKLSYSDKQTKPDQKIKKNSSYLWLGSAVIIMGCGAALYFYTQSDKNSAQNFEVK